ncbi:MAG: L-histidine N(alpha)-methyltransferase [Bacteroidota bacterium]
MSTTDVKSINTHMLDEVLETLRRPQKCLPSKYFYDERGSRLFEQICDLEEYYPTDADLEIMSRYIAAITDQLGSGIELIELGSGSSRKTRLLLEELEDLAAYMPVDISEEFLQQVADQLREDYPGLKVIPIAADYTRPFQIPDAAQSYTKRVAYYPGSTIGNFTPENARNFLGVINSLVQPDGGLLVGVDLKKDKEILERAYNDSQGITAAFNKNILIRLNRELGADFKVDQYEHRALFNKEEGRIEMHLVSQTDQTVTIDHTEFYIQQGETIHTENSYKYSLEEFEKLVAPHFEVEQVWTDSRDYFSVQYLVPKSV